MKTPRTGIAAAAAILLCGAAGGPSRAAESFLPLVLGNRWTYRLENGSIDVQTVERALEIRGRPAFAILHRIDDTPILEDYWSEDSGDVFYHGFYRPIKDFGILYEPPIRVLDAPLARGATWTNEDIELFMLPDSMSAGLASFSFAVESEEMVDVPAGSFAAFEIAPATPIAAGFAGTFPRRWVAGDVGVVRFDDGGIAELLSYSVSLPVAPATWGGIKWRAPALHR